MFPPFIWHNRDCNKAFADALLGSLPGRVANLKKFVVVADEYTNVNGVNASTPWRGG